jgi:hypothetical protein
MKLILFLCCGIALASQRAPIERVKSDVARPFFCGPMFSDNSGTLNPATTKCVGLVLATGHRATVGVFCRDGSKAYLLVTATPSGDVDIQNYDEVCGVTTDMGTPSDMSTPPDMAKKTRRVK